MRWQILPVIGLALSCGGSRGRGGDTVKETLKARFPLAQLDDRALCDKLLTRTETEYGVTIDPEPRTRRKAIVSDLHLGPGTNDRRFAGVEDFFSEIEWTTFLERQAAAGPTDLIIAGDFVEFWQIATALGALPRRDDSAKQDAGPVLAADQDTAVTAIRLVIDAHRSVFRDLGKLLDSGDHRVVIIAGNHDADLLWPKVQLAIAAAIDPRDPARLVFASGAAYEHGSVHIAHGHAYDAANRFETGHAPFGRDRNGRCRLQSSWGEIFVDKFYTETERQIPFIDNLHPASAAVLWAMTEDPSPQRDLGAALRFLDLVRVAESKKFNRDAVGSILQSTLGLPGVGSRGPESVREVLEHLEDRLMRGDANALSVVNALMQFRYDPKLASLWRGIVDAARALPDFPAALSHLSSVDPKALSHLRDKLFGDPLQTAAKRIASSRGIRVVVFGHTHHVGGLVQRLDKHAFYVNTGSWISVASVADLRARGITWDRLDLADRKMFPSKTTAVIVEYDGAIPRDPVVLNAR